MNMVSLFPAENGVEGSISPFRSDLLTLLKGLQPRCTVPACPALHTTYTQNALKARAGVIMRLRSYCISLPTSLLHASPFPEAHLGGASRGEGSLKRVALSTVIGNAMFQISTFFSVLWLRHFSTVMGCIQVPPLPWRLLCGGGDDAQRLLLEAQRGRRRRAARSLERHVAVLEHRRCALSLMCFPSTWSKTQTRCIYLQPLF